METPISNGPSVMMAQYTSTRCTSGRDFLTRQIWLNTLSMVDMVKTDVRISSTPPTAEMRADLAANWFR